MIDPKNVKIEILGDQAVVTLDLGPERAERLRAALRNFHKTPPGHYPMMWSDDVDEETFTCARVAGVQVSAGLVSSEFAPGGEERYGLRADVEVSGYDFDYTRVPEEIGLDERLAVAAAFRAVFAAEVGALPC